MKGTAMTSAPGQLWTRAAGIVAILLGLLTLRQGSAVLFWSEAARLDAGNYVPFVLWFNFLAGFAYVIAGIGLWLRKRWAVRLAVAIAAGTIITFIAFGIHVAGGGAFERRTVAAMTMRSTVWVILSAIGWRFLWRTPATGIR